MYPLFLTPLQIVHYEAEAFCFCLDVMWAAPLTQLSCKLETSHNIKNYAVTL